MSQLVLSQDQIDQLQRQGCRAADWQRVQIDPQTDLKRFQRVHFSGEVSIGLQDQEIILAGGLTRSCGIYNACLHGCCIGSNVYIHNVGQHIAHYEISDGVVIDDVSLLAMEGESSFGNGVQVAAVNEGGGREVLIYDRLSLQIAYLLAMYRHDRKLCEQIEAYIREYAESVSSSRGTIGHGSRITRCGAIRNVRIGAGAHLHGLSEFSNGSVNSHTQSPCEIGEGVIARDFVMSAGSRLLDGCQVQRCFIGQNVELARQFSATDCLFFANAQGHHGEACSVFAGPHCISHHKSTLLIACMASFYNAGSGTNQSNHMYKLGPVHQGVMERGVKTGSSSYLMWPSRIGAFSIVIGRHYSNMDTSLLPFSYLLESDKRTVCLPGAVLRNIGLIRDEQKWIQRDRRKEPLLDHVTPHVFSPYTVGRMRRGLRVLQDLENRQPSKARYTFQGVKIGGSVLQAGIELYQMAILDYLGDKLLRRLLDSQSRDEIVSRLKPTSQIGTGKWIDVGGLPAPIEMVPGCGEEIWSGDLEELHGRFEHIFNEYHHYEWNWVTSHLQEWTDDRDPLQAVRDILDKALACRVELTRMRIEDAKKDFGVQSRIGYGLDGDAEIVQADFVEVRGRSQDQGIITCLQEKLKVRQQETDLLLKRLATL